MPLLPSRRSSAPLPGAFAFVPNATAGVNAIVGSLDLHPDDEIVITDHGYNACKNIVDRGRSIRKPWCAHIRSLLWCDSRRRP